MRELILGEQVFQIEEGVKIKILDPTRMFGESITVHTDEYSADMTNLGRDGKYANFRVDTITEVIKPPKQLNTMLKTELVEYANSINVEVSTKMTKAQIIDAINSAIDN